VRIDPSNYEAYINAGGMVGRLAQSQVIGQEDRIKLNEQAVAFFKQAQFLRPREALACRQLGMSLLQRAELRNENDVGEAIHYLSRAVELEPDNPENHRLLEEARRRQNRKG
jgi:Flp pilus assembly protein TadD